jgi:hypothetical protein
VLGIRAEGHGVYKNGIYHVYKQTRPRRLVEPARVAECYLYPLLHLPCQLFDAAAPQSLAVR